MDASFIIHFVSPFRCHFTAVKPLQPITDRRTSLWSRKTCELSTERIKRSCAKVWARDAVSMAEILCSRQATRENRYDMTVLRLLAFLVFAVMSEHLR
jgi:hypothetical protein